VLTAGATEAPPTTKSHVGIMAAAAVAVLAVAGGAFALYRTGQSTEAAAVGLASSAVPSASVSAGTAAPKCPEGMVFVPGGKFFMGSDEAGLPTWKPAHKVELAPYCMDLREVTAEQYKACSDVGECKRTSMVSVWQKAEADSVKEHERKQEAYSKLCTFGKAGWEKHPINCVSWESASNYCKVSGKRLPTEAEWEFAARKSDGRKFPWGDDPPDQRHMNACGTECTDWMVAQGLKPGPRMYDADDGFPGTAPVGSYPKGQTAFGLDDMVGNVFEWTSDWMGPYSAEEQKDPRGPEQGEKRVVRGGAFNGGFTLWVNPSFRYAMPPEVHTHAVGFRCAKTAGG